ncbi:hypothetical protein EZJ55_00030 [Microcystis aeruginosa EAWAG127a]|uniref:Uncharacterized protein n=1 Tax=Microcystis aeruginosa EAWAG127a TaxID=2529855 RepID=A0A5J5M127_MICAE|nr:hypothetical protein [Microcystis aeruginosa]KAB0243975.1 hypothetical protein EZJ55_00030 [Microcystis aeruginosa EAWAG127a]
MAKLTAIVATLPMGNWFYVILTSALTPIILIGIFWGIPVMGCGEICSQKSEAFDRTVWLEKKLQREIDRLERQKEHAKNALSIPDRDKALRKLSQSLGLSRRHRQALLDRGLSESQIETGLFFSIYPNDDVPPAFPQIYPA